MRFTICALSSVLLGISLEGVQATGLLAQHDAQEGFEPFLGGADELLQLGSDSEESHSKSRWRRFLGVKGKADTVTQALLDFVMY